MNQNKDWTINALLAVILLLLGCFYYNNTKSRNAFAAGGSSWDTNGVMAMTGGGATDRLVIIDTAKQNLMFYKFQKNQGLKLSAARNYKYDLEVEDSSGTAIERGDGYTYKESKDSYEASKGAGKTK